MRQAGDAMATSTLVPLSEYLQASYRPDCDWMDGELRERNMGDIPHSYVQSFFMKHLGAREKELQIELFCECRMQVSPTRFRVPDVLIMREGDLDGSERIVRTPPLLCIEVLSPDDTLDSMQDRIDDYLAMGVEHIWILNPRNRRAYVADAQGLHAVEELAVPGTGIRVATQEVFAGLDRG